MSADKIKDGFGIVWERSHVYEGAGHSPLYTNDLFVGAWPLHTINSLRGPVHVIKPQWYVKLYQPGKPHPLYHDGRIDQAHQLTYDKNKRKLMSEEEAAKIADAYLALGYEKSYKIRDE